MTENRFFMIGLVAAMIAVVAGIYSNQRPTDSPPDTPPSLAKGSIDQLFSSTLNDANGKVQAFTQWQGKTLVINFWATWCPPCREEMPAFSRLQGKHVANGVQFVGIALDSQESVKDFSRQFPVIYPLLIGGNEGADLIRRLGNPQLALPYTLIVTPTGETRFARLGSLSEHELDTLLQQTSPR